MTEKKKSIIFAAILVIAVLSIIGVFAVKDLKQNGLVTNSEVKKIMKDFNKYFNKKDRTVIYYASTNCGYCELQTPILETIAKDYDMDYLYVDSSKLPSKQRKEVLDKLDIDHATPTTVIVENGEVIDTAVGYTDGRAYVEFFSENELIPEDAIYSAEKNLTYVTYDKFKDVISSDDDSIVVLGQTTCSHCIAVKPALNSIAEEYDLTINYLNLTDISEEQYNELVEDLKEIEYDDSDFVENGSFGTPLTLIIKNQKVYSYINGERSKSQFVREFKNSGLISK
ncbi:MAG: thioredoxin family protein [bacterium]|nr:thioredoxin family protein [bacterium]